MHFDFTTPKRLKITPCDEENQIEKRADNGG